MSYKFTFVILHYITIKDTTECVDSILNNVEYDNFQIIIVDNGSPNKTGKLLLEKYKNNSRIKVILNKENLGFARGNNVGFEYGKYELQSDFIALINNDTLLEQCSFITKIIDEYNKKIFHVLGPDILSTKDNEHQNPSRINFQTEKELQLLIKVYKIKLLLSYFLLDEVIERIKKRIFKKVWIKTGEAVIHSWKEKRENVKLHGSALIFSPDYIKLYDGLYSKTFMHLEESILHFIATRDNLRMIYYPEVQILHKEDSATDRIYKRNNTKRRFYYKSFIKSSKILLELKNKTNSRRNAHKM